MKPEEIKTQYDRIGEDYVREQARFLKENGDFATDFLLNAVGDLTRNLLIDIGCGDGSNLPKYLSAEAEIVYGVDPSSEMLAMAKRNLTPTGYDDQFSYRFFLGSAEETSIPRGIVGGAVTSRFSLNYVENLDKAWKEIGRVLAPEGILAFVAPHPIATAERSGKPYGTKGTFSYELFGSVPVTNYLHTFEDFFSPTFIENFAVESFTEFFGVRPRVEGTNGPSAFGVKARRKWRVGMAEDSEIRMPTKEELERIVLYHGSLRELNSRTEDRKFRFARSSYFRFDGFKIKEGWIDEGSMRKELWESGYDGLVNMNAISGTPIVEIKRRKRE